MTGWVTGGASNPREMLCHSSNSKRAGGQLIQETVVKMEVNVCVSG